MMCNHKWDVQRTYDKKNWLSNVIGMMDPNTGRFACVKEAENFLLLIVFVALAIAVTSTIFLICGAGGAPPFQNAEAMRWLVLFWWGSVSFISAHLYCLFSNGVYAVAYDKLCIKCGKVDISATRAELKDKLAKEIKKKEIEKREDERAEKAIKKREELLKQQNFVASRKAIFKQNYDEAISSETKLYLKRRDEVLEV